MPMPSRWAYEKLPKGTSLKKRRLYESVIPNEHIDRQFGLAVKKDGGKILVVNPTYYKFFKFSLFEEELGIDHIAKLNNWNLYVLSLEEELRMTANFKQLPDGRLLMVSPELKTAYNLEEITGKKVLVVPEDLVVDKRHTGGLNCRLNELMI